jgi:hypothetical protein
MEKAFKLNPKIGEGGIIVEINELGSEYTIEINETKICFICFFEKVNKIHKPVDH